MVSVTPREEFKDWKDKVEAPSGKALDSSVESKSWQTSRNVVEEVLAAVFKGTGVNGMRRCQIRHLTTWSAEAAKGVISLNVKKLPHMPRLSYCGTPVQDSSMHHFQASARNPFIVSSGVG